MKSVVVDLKRCCLTWTYKSVTCMELILLFHAHDKIWPIELSCCIHIVAVPSASPQLPIVFVVNWVVMLWISCTVSHMKLLATGKFFTCWRSHKNLANNFYILCVCSIQQSMPCGNTFGSWLMPHISQDPKMLPHGNLSWFANLEDNENRTVGFLWKIGKSLTPDICVVHPLCLHHSLLGGGQYLEWT